jgi:hypothetical protein
MGWCNYRQVFLAANVPGKKFKTEKARLDYCRNVLRLSTSENQEKEEGIVLLMTDALADHADAEIITTGKEVSVDQEEITAFDNKHGVKDAVREAAGKLAQVQTNTEQDITSALSAAANAEEQVDVNDSSSECGMSKSRRQRPTRGRGSGQKEAEHPGKTGTSPGHSKLGRRIISAGHARQENQALAPTKAEIKEQVDAGEHSEQVAKQAAKVSDERLLMATTTDTLWNTADRSRNVSRILERASVEICSLVDQDNISPEYADKVSVLTNLHCLFMKVKNTRQQDLDWDLDLSEDLLPALQTFTQEPMSQFAKSLGHKLTGQGNFFKFMSLVSDTGGVNLGRLTRQVESGLKGYKEGIQRTCVNAWLKVLSGDHELESFLAQVRTVPNDLVKAEVLTVLKETPSSTNCLGETGSRPPRHETRILYIYI